LKQLEVEHPAAKVLVELSQIQDREVGDGTTSVVILAAELLKRANELVKNKIHPTSIMSGYRLALKESVKFIRDHLLVGIDQLGKEALINAAKTSMSSKLIGSECEYFSELAVNAMQAVKTITPSGEVKYPVKAVNIIKCHGKSTRESMHVNGYALEHGRSAQGMPIKVENAKIACVDFNLNKFRLQMGVQVLVQDPDNLEKIRQKEMDVTKQRCQKIIDAGANVVLCSKGIDDFALKYFVENGVYAIRRVNKSHLRRISASSGAKIVVSMADEENGDEERFDPAFLGACEKVYETKIGDWDYTMLEGMNQTRAQTIIIRGANDFFVDEIQRSLHDSLCVVKRVLESKSVVAGGGSVEAALSIYLDEYAVKLGTREQLAVAEFSEALLCIPKILANNASQDATELIAKLRVYHNVASTTEDEQKKKLKYSGLDLMKGKVRNNLSAGVLEPTMSKIKSLKFATEAAITVLRIDDFIKLDAKE
jgi:T-complex protein 1 subunit alpha